MCRGDGAPLHGRRELAATLRLRLLALLLLVVDDGVDEERAHEFLAKALARSQKYQREYQKSQKRLKKTVRH